MSGEPVDQDGSGKMRSKEDAKRMQLIAFVCLHVKVVVAGQHYLGTETDAKSIIW